VTKQEAEAELKLLLDPEERIKRQAAVHRAHRWVGVILLIAIIVFQIVNFIYQRNANSAQALAMKYVVAAEEVSQTQMLGLTIAFTGMQLSQASMETAQANYNDLGQRRQRENQQIVKSMQDMVDSMQKHIDDQDVAMTNRIARARQEREELYAKINNAVGTMTDMMQDAIDAAHTATRAAESARAQSHATKRRVEQRLPNPTPKPWFHFP
jgi:uncharacterized protein YicC (UPF0701 family)